MSHLLSSFTHFKLLEFIPSLRNQLIEKWTHLSDKKKNIASNENQNYQHIDSNTELVNAALGKVIGDGIMPAFPFFILSVISTYETFAKPLDQEITSQGYCYQALIYMYLRKQGVKNDEIEIYINFLTEFSFYFFTEKKNELSIDEFNSFMKFYMDKYNLPIKQETLLKNLQITQIIELDSFNNYSFCYPYLYYFFVAKYIAEHIEDSKELIESILSNLHNDENAYIAIFISHHSTNVYILDEILYSSIGLFDKYSPATLRKKELSLFDEQVESIVKAVLPPTNSTAEIERAKRLEDQDAEEQTNQDEARKLGNDTDDELAVEMRRSIKTVEVMGSIIKNHAGSLEKSRLEYIFEEAMKVHLRILTSFIELIKDENEQKEIVDIIANNLFAIIKDKERKDKENNVTPRPLSRDKLENLSKGIFWNMNFLVVYGFINKIIHSLGSNKLTAIFEKVCDNENTPASFLIKHGILMWFNKNLQIDNITKKFDEDDYSETVKKIMDFMIVNHCSMHTIGYKDKQKIEHKLGISSQRLIKEQYKGH